jgi:hypothetical protein
MKNQLIFLSIVALFFTDCKNSETNSEQGNVQVDSTSVNKIPTGKLAVFEWDDELCHKKGFYDSELYTYKELEDTYYLWFKSSGILLPKDYSYTVANFKVFNQEDALKKLEQDYLKTKAKFQQLQLPKNKVWEETRASRLKELDDFYELYSLKIMSYNNPEALLKSRFNGKCREYALALNGSTTKLMEHWESLVREMVTENSAPDLLWQEYRKQRASPDSIAYAKTELISFGWFNNANHQIDYPSSNESLSDDFEKLFRKVEDIECADPD